MKTILITENQFKYLVNYIIKEDIEKEQEKAIKQIKLRHKMEDWFVDKVLPKLEKVILSNYMSYVYKNTRESIIIYDRNTNRLFISGKIFLYFNDNYSKDDDELKVLIRHLVGEYLNIWDINEIRYLYN